MKAEFPTPAPMRRHTNSANASSGQPLEMVAMLNNCSPKCTHDSNSHRLCITFRKKLHEMRGPLAPLVPISTSVSHPAFSNTILQFWPLTEEELDEMAEFYHPAADHRYSNWHPKRIKWRPLDDLKTRRRRWGQFIGLRGCDIVKDGVEAQNWERAIWASVRRGVAKQEQEERKLFTIKTSVGVSGRAQRETWQRM